MFMLGLPPKILKQELCQNNYAKNQKHSMRLFVIQLKKLTLGFFYSKPQYRIFPKKIIGVNFQSLHCCNYMQKLRKIPCNHFSQNLQKFILGPFWPKHSKLNLILSFYATTTSCKNE